MWWTNTPESSPFVKNSVPDGRDGLQEVGVARQGGGGHNGILRVVFRHNFKLGAQYRYDNPP